MSQSKTGSSGRKLDAPSSTRQRQSSADDFNEEVRGIRWHIWTQKLTGQPMVY